MANNIWIATTTVYSTAGNWSGGVPVSTNNAYLSAAYSTLSMLSGLAQSAVTLASLNLDLSYAGLIGNPQLNGTATEYLAIGATVANIGTPVAPGLIASGSGRINLNLANASAIVNVLGTAAQANDAGYTPLLLLGTTLAINASGGVTGVALNVGETASVATLKMVAGASSPVVLIGPGCTLTTAIVEAGTLTSNSAVATTATVRRAGNLIYGGTGGFTALTIADGCTVLYNGTGTITSLIPATIGGTLDLSQGTGAVTLTNYTAIPGLNIRDPLGRLTRSNLPTYSFTNQESYS